MKKILPLLSGLLVILLAPSCANTRYVSKADVRAIRGAAIITPCAYITSIGDYGEVYDDSLSAVCSGLIAEAVKQSKIPILEEITCYNTDSEYRDALTSLAGMNPKTAGSAPVPEYIDSLVKASGQRYGVVAHAFGFSKEPKKMRQEAAVGAGVAVGVAVLTAVLTGGAAVGTSVMVPKKGAVKIWLGIIDSETHKFIYYDSYLGDDTNPVNSNQMFRAVKDLMKDFDK